MKNPYRPGVGLRPTYLAGRDPELRRYVSTLSGAPEIPANVRLTGLRGVGKSVLLSRFEDLGRDVEWATLLLELQPRHNSDKGFLGLMTDQLGRLAAKLSTGERVRQALGKAVNVSRRAVRAEVEGVTWSIDGQIAGPAAEVGDQLLNAIDAALGAGLQGLVLLLDEAQVISDERRSGGEHPLSTLLSAVSTLQKQEIPVALVLCGLPTLTVNLLAARTYSERMFRGEEVGSLESGDAQEALVKPLEGTGRSASNELVERVLAEVDGYPYFIQLWGAEVWDACTFAGEDILTVDQLDAVSRDIYRRLDLDFYEPRVASLTPAEQDVLLDTSRCSYPPIVVSELGDKSSKTAANVNVLLGRLVSANVLYRIRKGRYQYTAPGFFEYLCRRSEAEGS